MRERMKKAMPWLQTLGIVGSVVVAGFSYMETQTKANKGAETTAAAAAVKADVTYEMLAKAVKDLGQDVKDQQKIIGDMREAIGELRGAVSAARARHHFRGEGGDAMGRLGVGSGKSKPSKMEATKAARVIDLPDALPAPEPQMVQRYLDAME